MQKYAYEITKRKRGRAMKKRQRIIAALLSLAMVFGLCGSNLTVQTVKAQEVQEVQEDADDENQEQEEIPEAASVGESMEETEQEGDQTEEAVPEEKDGEASGEEAVQKTGQKAIAPQTEDTGNEDGGSDAGDSDEDDGEDNEEDDWDKYTLYYDSLINGRYYTSSGNFADGETVAMEIEASSEIKDAVITYEWYKAGSKDASVDNATKLNVNKNIYNIKKSEVKTEYYICRFSDGNQTKDKVFEIKGILLKVSKYVNDKPEDTSEEYLYGSKVKLEVRPEKVDSKYQISYQWRERKRDEDGDRGEKQDIAGATGSVYNAEIEDTSYSRYYCVVTLKEGNEVIQSEEYSFLLSAKEALTAKGAIYVDGKKYIGTSRSVYEDSEIKLEVTAETNYKDGKIEYNWHLEGASESSGNSNSYSFNKGESERQYLRCEVTDGVNSKDIDFYIYKESRIKGVRQIDGRNGSSVYCSTPDEKHELKVNISSKPTGNGYEYIWERYKGISDYYDEDRNYEKINDASGAICNVKGDITGDTTYYCTVKDGTDIKRFIFYVYVDSLNCECTVNQEEGSRIQVVPGEKVTLGVRAESSYRNDAITYKWYQGWYDGDDYGEDGNNRKVLGEESSYTFVKNAEVDDEGDCIEWYSCEVSDGFQTSYLQFEAEANNVSLGGIALIDGKSYPHDFYDAYIPAVHDKSYRLEVKMTSEPESGKYKYQWGTYNEATGMSQKLSTTSECTVKGGLSYENDDADWYVCIVSDGDKRKEFKFCLEPYSITADQKINGASASEVYLPAGETVELSIAASSTYTSSDKIKYSWRAGSDTEITGIANGNKYTVPKSEDMEQEYICVVKDGYSSEVYYFTLYSDVLGVPVYTIDGKAVSDLQCGEGTKHTITVDASCKIEDEDIEYKWARIDENKNYTDIERKNKNTLTFTRRGKTETYRCTISVAGVERRLYFNFFTDGEACQHKFAQKITKATMTKDGSIVNQCTVCGKVNSSERIPYPKTIRLSSETFTYNGKVQRPAVTVIGSDGRTIASSNYTVSYSAGSTAAGTYAATITFKGNYTGSVKKTYTIKNSAPSAGTVLRAPGTKASYKVVKAGKTVEYKSAPNKKVKTASIPSTVKINNVTYKVIGIAPSAFRNCKKLKKVTIGANVTSIGKQAFYGCKSLKTVTVKSKSVKKVGSKAFKGIHKKASIKVPKAKLKAYKKLFKKGGVSKSVKIKK